MIRFVHGDILAAPLDFAIVVPVNVMGVAGAGLAKQVAEKYPLWESDYKMICRNKHLVAAGNVVVAVLPQCERRYWINFATKTHWKDASDLSAVEKGLKAMAGLENLPQKFAIPALGCGLGGLLWDQVKPLILEHLSGLDRMIWVFEP